MSEPAEIGSVPGAQLRSCQRAPSVEQTPRAALQAPPLRLWRSPRPPWHSCCEACRFRSAERCSSPSRWPVCAHIEAPCTNHNGVARLLHMRNAYIYDMHLNCGCSCGWSLVASRSRCIMIYAGTCDCNPSSPGLWPIRPCPRDRLHGHKGQPTAGLMPPSDMIRFKLVLVLV